MDEYRPHLILIYSNDDGLNSFLELNQQQYDRGSVDRSYVVRLTDAQGVEYEDKFRPRE